MSLCYGETLFSFIEQERNEDLLLVAQVLVKLAHRLAEVHAAGLCHNDLHTENVMVHVKSGKLRNVAIIDYG